MMLQPPQRRVIPRRAPDRGFTLIELLIAIVLSGVIAGVTVAALATSMNIAKTTTDEVNDSTDAGLISAFFFRDAQSAGGVDPATALDTALGVSNSLSDPTGLACANPEPAVATQKLAARFSWIDRTSASPPITTVVTYSLDATTQQLTRRVCTSDVRSAVDLVLARHLTRAEATCSPACTGRPTTVTLTITGSGTQPSRALTASLRGGTQVAPQSSNSSQVALMALRKSGACPNLNVGLTGADVVTVIGDVLVDGSCGPAPITDDLGKLTPTGTKGWITGLSDPFAGLVPPAFTSCGGAGPNPEVGVNNTGLPDAVIVYPLSVAINAPVSFNAGRYVFCNGLDIQSLAAITGNPVDPHDGVLLYVHGGTLAIAAGATVDLSAPAAGVADANLLIWVPAANPQTITIAGGPRVNNLRGLIYAPTSTLMLTSEVAANIGGAIVKDVNITGVGAARIGLPVPVQSISPASIAAGQVAVAYSSGDLTATGGTPPYTWKSPTASLPPGLSIDPSTGRIWGTPTSAGSYPIVVTAFDATKAAVSKDYTITVGPQLTITGPAATLPGGQVNVAYPATQVVAAGGTGPYTWYMGVPTGAGLTINASTGVITGTPTSSGGPFSKVVTVTDANGITASKTFTIMVAAQLTISGPATLPNGQVGVAYPSTTVASAGGTGTKSWSATALPAGLTIDSSTGVIAGTPTAAGSFSPVVTVTDAMTGTATKTYAAITIAAQLTINAPTSMPNGQVGVVYPSTTVTSVGGTGPYLWSATLPSGLTFDTTTHVISGTPTSPGTFFPSVRVTDALTSVTRIYTITIAAQLTISAPATLPNGQVGVVYPSTTVTSAGGTGTKVWSATALPAGVTINSSTGVISGTPTAAGSFSPVVTVTDATTGTATRNYAAITINSQLVISAPATLPNGQVGVAYSSTVTATGGAGTKVWSATALPAGVTINSSTGVISGTPTTAGSYSPVVTVTDTLGTATKNYAAITITAVVPNGVAVTPSSYRGQNDGVLVLSMTNSSPITALSVTISVVQTTGVTSSSSWASFWAGTYTLTNGTSGGVIRYMFDLNAGQTIVAGSWQMNAQWLESNGIHPTSGDTWSVTSTSSGITRTLTGTFP